MTVERPAGVTAVAAAFLLAAAYLLAVGADHAGQSRTLVSMAAGAELLGGLELAGPYFFLLSVCLRLLFFFFFGLTPVGRWAQFSFHNWQS